MKPWGCFNRADYLPGYTIHGVSKESGLPVSTTMPFVMSKDCQYTLTKQGRFDAMCDGCKWKTNLSLDVKHD